MTRKTLTSPFLRWRMLGLLLLLITSLPVMAASEVKINVDPPTPAPTTAKPAISVSFTGNAANYLYLSGQPIELIAHIANSGAAQPATATISVSTGLGITVLMKDVSVKLPEQGQAELPVFKNESVHWPNGPYTVEVSVLGEQGIGYGATHLSLWNGPTEKTTDFFGISYNVNGPLNADRTWKDLDLFRTIGISWLRFPLQGWLPQGDARPVEAEQYNTFVQEASKRDYHLVALFTPRTTVDPSINPLQTEKELRESLLAATTRYGFKVKYWELQRMRPDPAFPDMKGIGYSLLAAGREAMRTSDKTLQPIFSLDYPFKWNAIEYYAQSSPAAEDILGMRYNFIGIPENRDANPTPPIYELGDVGTSAPKKLKHPPATWVTEYGFDAGKGDRLPKPAYQAALIARALLINCACGISHTFWRHTPGAQYDLPLTNDDGSVQPSLLGLRTTLGMLDGVTQVTELSPQVGVRAYMLCYGGDKKQKKVKPHYVLAVWSDSQTLGMTLKTSASVVPVTDFWGNTLELHPIEGVTLCQVDEFPRFLELGDNPKVELNTPFARFEPGRLVLHDGSENIARFVIWNDSRFFHGKVVYKLNFRRWPELTADDMRPDEATGAERSSFDDNQIKSVETSLNPSDNNTFSFRLRIPKTARKGSIYEVSVDILVGTRRIGFLTLPVGYSPTADTGAPKK